MKYLIILPDKPYYLWQMLVQITNFREVGIEEDAIFIVAYTGAPSPTLMRIVDDKDVKSRIVVYNDNRINSFYPSSVRLFLMTKFMEENEDIRKGTIFYMDSDVVFTKKPNFDHLLQDDSWYISGTKDVTHYMDSIYIRSKGEDIFELMCDIVCIPRNKVIQNDDKCGGVQYIIKNAPVDFWRKAYFDSEALFQQVTKLSNKKLNDSKLRGDDPVYHPLQIWCADMWAMLWNAWLFGVDIKPDDAMTFCWAGWDVSKWNELAIFHNAGITTHDGINFNKIEFQTSPFKKSIGVAPTSASYKYLQLIRRTEMKFPQLIW